MLPWASFWLSQHPFFRTSVDSPVMVELEIFTSHPSCPVTYLGHSESGQDPYEGCGMPCAQCLVEHSQSQLFFMKIQAGPRSLG